MGNERSPLSRQRSPWVERSGEAVVAALETIVDVVGFAPALFEREVGDGRLRALVADEDPIGWHLSISFVDRRGRPSRYPTWDEIADARERLLPPDRTFVMFLPPSSEYVAVHDSTFHLHEYREVGK